MGVSRVPGGDNTRKSSRAPSIQAKPHPGTDLVNETMITEAEEPADEIIYAPVENATFTSQVNNAISLEAHTCSITPSHVR